MSKGEMQHRNDVIIIGAGVIGASIAYHLCRLGVTNVLILEREEFPGTGSTSKANGGIRAQFTTAMNISMSLLSMRLLDEMDEEMQRQSGYLKAGYLFMTAERQNLKRLEENVRFQRQHGVSVELLTREEINSRVPFVQTEDLLAGSFGNKDGFIDPNGLTNAFLTRALAMGAHYRNRTAVLNMLWRDKRIIGVMTSAREFIADAVVNCAGPEANAIANMAGIDLPVVPIRRQIVMTGPTNALPPRIPMTIDMDTGLLIRREGDAVSLTYSNPDEPPGLNFKFDPEYVEVIAPKMMERFPILESAGFNFSKCYAGCYEVTPDHHAIIGESGVPGFYLCNGFSGHGVMHSPAAGWAMAELLTKSRTQSIDISPLSHRRFAEGKLLHEGAVL